MLGCLPGDVLRLICRKWLGLFDIASLRGVCRFCAKNLSWKSVATHESRSPLRILVSEECNWIYLLDGNRAVIEFAYPDARNRYNYHYETVFGTISDGMFYPVKRYRWDQAVLKTVLSPNGFVFRRRCRDDPHAVDELRPFEFSEKNGAFHLYSSCMVHPMVFYPRTKKQWSMFGEQESHLQSGFFTLPNKSVVPSSFPFEYELWTQYYMLIRFFSGIKTERSRPDINKVKKLKVLPNNNSVYYHPLEIPPIYGSDHHLLVGLIDIDENGEIIQR